MPVTPHAFTDEEALACLETPDKRQAQVQFVARLMARCVWQGVLTSDKLCELWGINPDGFRGIREQAKAVWISSLNHEDENLRREVLNTLIHTRDEAFKSYEKLMNEDNTRTAQKFLETAKSAAASIAQLLPKQAGSGDEGVTLVVELGSPERPKE